MYQQNHTKIKRIIKDYLAQDNVQINIFLKEVRVSPELILFNIKREDAELHKEILKKEHRIKEKKRIKNIIREHGSNMFTFSHDTLDYEQIFSPEELLQLVIVAKCKGTLEKRKEIYKTLCGKYNEEIVERFLKRVAKIYQ
jgi:hypothetical protein